MNVTEVNRQYEIAKALVSEESLSHILTQLVDIASPTGEEARLARHISSILCDYDLAGEEQQIDHLQSNALGHISGCNEQDGTHLMLYAPIDTVTSSNEQEDLPWLADEMKPEMWSKSRSDGEFIFGLGAHNPKGHAACIIEAARVLRSADIPLAGRLSLGFGAGGMPTTARQGIRDNSGHGAGCEALLNKKVKPDCAVIAKSGWSVSWEEVGLIWFEVTVEGDHNYVGSRHLMPYTNPIVDAARLIEKIEAWLIRWPDQHRSGLVAPQGVVSYIESGWRRMPAFTPAACRFRIDLRLSPRTDSSEAEAEFASVLKRFSDELGIKASYQRLVAIEGTNTSPDAPIIKQTINAWEFIEQQTHQPTLNTSGATDANILRAYGVPTARVGLPKASLPDMDFQLGMNAVAIDDLYKLTLLLLYTTISVCNSPLPTLGGNHG